MYQGVNMQSRKWMDLDGSWVYSTATRRHPDSHLGYNTLPGRNSMDNLRRPFNDRGVYGTIPGRSVNRGPVGDQSPYRLLPASRFSSSSILQDSTNWSPPIPSGMRGTKMVRMDEKTDTKRHDRRKYDERRYDKVRHSEDLERTKRKLLREAEAEVMNVSLDKHGRTGKSLEKDKVYEQPAYAHYQKTKVSQFDDWEPLSQPPKALQTQTTTQTSKLPPSQPQSIKEKPNETNVPVQEKKRWWFKSQKQPKQAVPETSIMDNPQGESYKKYLDQSTLAIYNTHTLHSSKENQPKIRKRKGPPPYVPPPSYNSPHNTFPISKEKHKVTDERSVSEIAPLTNGRAGEKMARFALEHTNSNLNPPSSINLNRVQANKTQSSEPMYQYSIWDRKLPQVYNTWGGQRSKWNRSQPASGDYDFLDHIYETVEGGSSPLSPNIPVERTNGTISISQRDQTECTLPRRGDKDMTKTTKKNKITANGDSQKMAHFDVHRPSLRSHGVKLPYELGFSYTSGKSQFTDKILAANYKTFHDLDEDDMMNERRRPLTVISNKERRVRVHTTSLSSKEEYGRFSQTLPLKKSSYSQPNSNLQEKMPTRSLKYTNSTDDMTFPKVKELGKISTLPDRGYNKNPWTGSDVLDRNVKYDLSELSETHNTGAPRKGQLKKNAVEKPQSPISKENGGMFVIDATCVVVKAEYIFPPQTAQVKFISYPEEPQGPRKRSNLSNQGPLVSNAKERPISLYDSQSMCNVKNATNCYLQNPKTESADLLPERYSSNLKERALRILGLSMVELESLKEGEALYETTKLTEQDSEVLEETHCERERFAEQELNSCTRPSYNATADMYSATKSLLTREDDAHKQPFNTALPVSKSGEENHKLGPKQSTSACAMQVKHMESDPTITSIGTVSLENKSNKINLGKIPEPVQSPLQNNTTSSEREVEAHYIEENFCEMIGMPHQNEVPTTMDLQVAINSRHLDNTKHVSDDSIETSTFRTETTIEKPEIFFCRIKDLVNEETSHEPCHETVQEDDRQPTNKKHAEYSKNTLNFAGRAASDSMTSKSKTTDAITNCSSYEAHSLGTKVTPIKPYTKRHNYFAKDLREAVSRIRRHTAPDSDTDEELEKSLHHSVLERSEDCRGEGVASCSSDTSDSEVTVILREVDKEDLASENTECSQETIEIEKTLNDKEIKEESTFAGSSGENRPEKSLIPETHQETTGLDLNSCIEEILHDLNRTEEEFFPLNSDNTVTPTTE